MIEISNQEISDNMFFIREENSTQPIAVVKVSDLLKFKRPQCKWIESVQSCKCSKCGSYALYWKDIPVLSNFCPTCGAYMRGEEND